VGAKQEPRPKELPPDAVDPGLYKIEVTAGGFKTISRDNVIRGSAITTADFAPKGADQ
jgi:hypothetical protein